MSNDLTQSLKGARFRIFRANLTEWINGDYDSTNLGYTSIDTGVFFVDSLPYGKYYVVETVAPSGYSGNTDKVCTVVVTADGVQPEALNPTDEISSTSTNETYKALYRIIHPTATP